MTDIFDMLLIVKTVERSECIHKRIGSFAPRPGYWALPPRLPQEARRDAPRASATDRACRHSKFSSIQKAGWRTLRGPAARVRWRIAPCLACLACLAHPCPCDKALPAGSAHGPVRGTAPCSPFFGQPQTKPLPRGETVWRQTRPCRHPTAHAGMPCEESRPALLIWPGWPV